MRSQFELSKIHQLMDEDSSQQNNYYKQPNLLNHPIKAIYPNQNHQSYHNSSDIDSNQQSNLNQLSITEKLQSSESDNSYCSDQYYDFEEARNRKRYKFSKKSNKYQGEQNKQELKRIINFKSSSIDGFVDLASKQKQILIEINDVPTYFPYQPYTLQVTYMRRVIEALQNRQNALLESPTGTGKTLCLLSSALSWAYTQKLKGRHRKIIYLSRTHSQLIQTQRQLKKTCFRPTMGHIGSRDYFCIKSELKDLKGHQKMESCSKGIMLKKKNDRGEIKWKELRKEQAQQYSNTMCNFYKQKNQTVNIGTSNFSNQVFEMQQFLKQGLQHDFCPYYYPFHMDQYCDLFMMPYNYILDIDLLPRFSKMIQGGILIFDQAHNVPEASCEGRSYQFVRNTLEGSQAELKKILYQKGKSKQLKAVKKRYLKDIKNMQQYILDFKQTIDEFMRSIQWRRCPNLAQKLYSGQENELIKVFDSYNMHLALYEMFKGVMIDEDNRTIFNNKGDFYNKCIHQVVNQINQICKKIDSLAQSLEQTIDGTFHNMKKLSIFYKRIANLLSNSSNSIKDFVENEINHFRLIIRIKLQNQQVLQQKLPIKNYTIELRCLVPWLTFENLAEYHPHSIIFTSGTLSPLDSWQSELNIEVPVKLVNTHVISQKQVRLNILKQNMRGSRFDFRFKNVSQNTTTIYKELIQTIFQISKKVPNGMLVVCPNFKSLNQIRYLINSSEIRNKMARIKKQIFQQKGNQKYIQQFRYQSQEGAILYCVCRGRASQGIDFPDHNCRAVVFVGVPFPNINDPIIVQRRDHFQKLQKYKKMNGTTKKCPGLNWEKWYFYGTIRAINQSLGRLIRHAKDYGMLFLLDQRYYQSRFQNAMPNWTQKSISVWRQFTHKKIQIIDQFYIKNQETFNPIIKRIELPQHLKELTIFKAQQIQKGKMNEEYNEKGKEKQQDIQKKRVKVENFFKLKETSSSNNQTKLTYFFKKKTNDS